MFQFVSGLTYNLKGLRYLGKHRALWKYILIPSLINVTLFACLLMLVFHYTDDVLGILMQPVQGVFTTSAGGVWGAVSGFFLWLIGILFKMILILLALILTGLVVFVAGSMINAPFYEKLSEEILVLHAVWQAPPFSWRRFLSNLTGALKFEAGKAALMVLGAVVFMLLSWIPVLGLLSMPVQLVYFSWLFAWGICAFPFLLNGDGFKKIFMWGTANKLALAGFGLPSLVPFLGLLFLPCQVVGGTLLYLDIKARETKLT